MAKKTWVDDIKEAINDAVGDKSISKEELADGMDEIASEAEEWAKQMRRELEGKE